MKALFIDKNHPTKLKQIKNIKTMNSSVQIKNGSDITTNSYCVSVFITGYMVCMIEKFVLIY